MELWSSVNPLWLNHTYKNKIENDECLVCIPNLYYFIEPLLSILFKPKNGWGRYYNTLPSFSLLISYKILTRLALYLWKVEYFVIFCVLKIHCFIFGIVNTMVLMTFVSIWVTFRERFKLLSLFYMAHSNYNLKEKALMLRRSLFNSPWHHLFFFIGVYVFNLPFITTKYKIFVKYH